MNLLLSTSREIVLGGHLLAIGTASIAATSAILLSREPTLPLLLMAYLFSYGAYMINRNVELDQDTISHGDRTRHLVKRRGYFPLIVGVCFVTGYVLALFSNLLFFFALFIPLILALLYSVGSKKLVGLLGVSKLKERLVVKNVIISFGWSLIPVLVGLYYLDLPYFLLFFSPFIFFRLIENTILFDIRDVKADATYGIKTLPTTLGMERSYQIMSIVDFLSALYLLIMVIIRIFPNYALFLLVLPLYSMVYTWLARKQTTNLDIICDVIADGEYLLWGPLMSLGQIIVACCFIRPI